MKTLLVTAAVAACCAPCWAQSPPTNPMPDGSRDMYVGAGVGRNPIYEGARATKVDGMPVVQVQWSNGVFVSGMTLGWHWSNAPEVEFGPLLALDSRRTVSGTSAGIGALGDTRPQNAALVMPAPPGVAAPVTPGPTRLAGLDEIAFRLVGGGFYHLYLNPHLRLTNSVLAGSGNDRRGARWTIDLQQIALPLATHHTVSAAFGTTLVNRAQAQSYFGVTPLESARSGNPAYAPGGGFKDVHAGVRWNWALGNTWLLTSSMVASRLVGDAAASPLVERRNTLSLTTALAYRY